MKARYLLSVVMMVFFYSCVQGQVVLSPKYHQFGKVKPGKTYHLKATISNPTDQTVSLWNLRADCDCTVAHIAKAVLKPKASTTLTIDYRPDLGENGFKNLTVNFQVYSQDKVHGIQRKMETFMFNAEVHSPYLFIPTTLDASETLFGHEKKTQGELALDKETYPQWQAGKAGSSLGGFETDIKPSKTPGIYDVFLTVPATTQPGDYKGQIVISGKKAKDTSFQYPFHAIVGSLWNVEPKFLNIDDLDPEKLKNWKFETQIRNVYGKNFKVLKVDGAPQWLSFDQDKNKAGDFVLRWKINEDELKKSFKKPFGSLIQITTDSKEEPTINIVLNAFWPAPTATPTPKVTATPSPQTQTKK